MISWEFSFCPRFCLINLHLTMSYSPLVYMYMWFIETRNGKLFLCQLCVEYYFSCHNSRASKMPHKPS